jgi:hypothetical protein
LVVASADGADNGNKAGEHLTLLMLSLMRWGDQLESCRAVISIGYSYPALSCSLSQYESCPDKPGIRVPNLGSKAFAVFSVELPHSLVRMTNVQGSERACELAVPMNVSNIECQRLIKENPQCEGFSFKFTLFHMLVLT